MRMNRAAHDALAAIPGASEKLHAIASAQGVTVDEVVLAVLDQMERRLLTPAMRASPAVLDGRLGAAALEALAALPTFFAHCPLDCWVEPAAPHAPWAARSRFDEQNRARVEKKRDAAVVAAESERLALARAAELDEQDRLRELERVSAG